MTPLSADLPAELSLTCNRGPRGHTLSRADRGRSRGDRGQPPPRTGHLEAEGSKANEKGSAFNQENVLVVKTKRQKTKRVS